MGQYSYSTLWQDSQVYSDGCAYIYNLENILLLEKKSLGMNMRAFDDKSCS
jgi:hypothetical protein